MTSLAEAFGHGRGCFGREGVLRCTGTFPDSYRGRLRLQLAILRATECPGEKTHPGR